MAGPHWLADQDGAGWGLQLQALPAAKQHDLGDHEKGMACVAITGDGRF